jgi:hypothetical protein
MTFNPHKPIETDPTTIWLNNIYGLPMEAVDRMACMDEETLRYCQPVSYRGRSNFYPDQTIKLLEMAESGWLSGVLDERPELKEAVLETLKRINEEKNKKEKQ